VVNHYQATGPSLCHPTTISSLSFSECPPPRCDSRGPTSFHAPACSLCTLQGVRSFPPLAFFPSVFSGVQKFLGGGPSPPSAVEALVSPFSNPASNLWLPPRAQPPCVTFAVHRVVFSGADLKYYQRYGLNATSGEQLRPRLLAHCATLFLTHFLFPDEG